MEWQAEQEEAARKKGESCTRGAGASPRSLADTEQDESETKLTRGRGTERCYGAGGEEMAPSSL